AVLEELAPLAGAAPQPLQRHVDAGLEDEGAAVLAAPDLQVALVLQELAGDPRRLLGRQEERHPGWISHEATTSTDITRSHDEHKGRTKELKSSSYLSLNLTRF